MNRAQRRKQGIKTPPPKMMHLTEDDYKLHINQAYRKGVNAGFDKACNYAVAYMMGVPLLVLNDNFNEIRLKEFNGVPRVEHFFDLCSKVYEEYNEGENSLERLLKDVSEKTGFDIGKRLFEKDEDN